LRHVAQYQLGTSQPQCLASSLTPYHRTYFIAMLEEHSDKVPANKAVGAGHDCLHGSVSKGHLEKMW
jgi:hypothetical protein